MRQATTMNCASSLAQIEQEADPDDYDDYDDELDEEPEQEVDGFDEEYE